MLTNQKADIIPKLSQLKPYKLGLKPIETTKSEEFDFS